MTIQYIQPIDIALQNDQDVDTAREVLLYAGQKALFTKIRENIETGVWDGRSGIWELTPQQIQDGPATEIPTGGVLIYLRELTPDGNGTRMLQPFKPGVSGFQPILAEEAETVLETLATDIANDRLRSAVYAALPDNFLSPFDPNQV